MPNLKQLVHRYKTDVKLLERHREDPSKRAFLERRIEQHKNDIVEYVTADRFQLVLNNLSL